MKFLLLVGFFFCSAIQNLSATNPRDVYESAVRDYLEEYPNTITFHLLKSPKLIDWNASIAEILLTLAQNFYVYRYQSRYSIGHISVELKCGKHISMVGQAAQDISQMSRKLLKEGVGLSLLLTPEERAKNPKFSEFPLVTVPGRLETESELVERYHKLLERDDGLLHLLSYRISDQQCKQASHFLKQYREKTKTTPLAGNIYGFGASPSKFEGAGCIAFAGEFFRHTGLWSDYQNFFYRLKVPLKLFGNPRKNRRVSLWDLIKSGFQSDLGEWVELEIPSPSLAHRLVSKTIEVDAKDFLGKKLLKKAQVKGSRKTWHMVVDGVL